MQMNENLMYPPNLNNQPHAEPKSELTVVAQIRNEGYPQTLSHERRMHVSELEKRYEELQNAHIALEASCTHYVELYDLAPVGYLTVNPEGKIAEINLTAARLFGVDRKNLFNQPFKLFITDEFKDCWERCFLDAKQHIGKQCCELFLCCGQGANVFIHLDILNANADVGVPRFQLILTDVSKRKQSDEALRIAAAAFETQSGIIVADANEIILSVNKAFTRITGHAADYAIGKTPYFLRSGLHDKVFYEALWADVVSNGYWEGEIWNKHKTGDIYPIWQTITAIADENRAITHYVASFTDITGQKQAEKFLLDVREHLENQVAITKEELKETKVELTEISAALNVLLKHRGKDETDAQIAFSQEVEGTVFPLLKRLKAASNGRIQSARLIGIIETSLQQLVKAYGRTANLTAEYQKLSPIETQVAAMVRQGLPTKVIAKTLNITSGTVSIHRKHIRKKLDLDGKATNLHSYLLSLTE
jgi:PAS domain S-box-containing protein